MCLASSENFLDTHRCVFMRERFFVSFLQSLALKQPNFEYYLHKKMILKSSSIPCTKTVLSHLDSPNRDSNNSNNYNSSKYRHHHHKLSFSYGSHCYNLNTPFSCSPSSPLSETKQELRRAWSDSSLDSLKTRVCGFQEEFPYRRDKKMLHSVPSLSIFNNTDGSEDEEKNAEQEETLMRTVTIGESIDAIDGGDFSFNKNSMGLIEEGGDEEEREQFNGVDSLDNEEVKEPPSPPLYLAAGLGIGGYDFGGGNGGAGDLNLPSFDGNGDIEEYYKRMVEHYPCHPLFLSNYAQLLQSKGDIDEALDYYHRATLADPEDGQILFKYAKLDWEVNHDKDRALSNFQRAAQVAPQDSHILAGYASFLWEIGDAGEEDMPQQEHIQVREDESVYDLRKLDFKDDFEPLELPPTLGVGVQEAASNIDQVEKIEEQYKKMVDESPLNPLVLRNYAQFLHESKGDLQGAEKYLLRAVMADPKNGEIMSRYAKLVWQLHHDYDKASSYYEQATQAAPEDSYVLASYASFLWETEEKEASSNEPVQFQVPVLNGDAVTAANAQCH